MSFVGKSVEATRASTSVGGDKWNTIECNDVFQLDQLQRRSSSASSKNRSFSIESILGPRIACNETKDSSADIDDPTTNQRCAVRVTSSTPCWSVASTVPDSVVTTNYDNDDDVQEMTQHRVLSTLNFRTGPACFPLDVIQANYVTTDLPSSLPPSARLFQKCRLRRHRSDRKPRQPFTDSQLETLETAFSRQPYLSIGERSDVAASLGIDEQRVKIWFQNRRAKCRRISEARIDERNRTRLIVAAAAAVAASGVGEKSGLFPVGDNGWISSGDLDKYRTATIGFDDEPEKTMKDGVSVDVFEEGRQDKSIYRLFDDVGLERRLSNPFGLYRRYLEFIR